MSAEVKNFLAVDVGATNLRVGIVAEGGSVIRKVKAQTPQSGDEFTVARKVITLAKDLISSKILEVEAIGVGTIGPLRISTGEVVNTPNNRLRNFKLLEPIKDELKIPTYVVNDCSAAVWGEFIWGNFSGVRDLIYVTLSTGVGGGIIIDGTLLLGREGNAHEVGHIVLNYKSGSRCGCGGVGHWEGLGSGRNFPNLINELELSIRPQSLPQLFDLWRSGNSDGAKAVKELIEVHAAGLASLINLFDPEAVVVGGATPLKNPDIFKLILKEVRHYLMRSPPPLSLPTFGEDAVLVGAAAIASHPPHNLLRLQS